MATKENNFKCPKSGDEFYFYEHSMGFNNAGKIYKDKYGKQLVHPETGEVLIPIEKPPVDWSGSAPAVIAGKGKWGQQKTQEQLKKRSKEHFKKEIAESKYEKNKELIKKFEAK